MHRRGEDPPRRRAATSRRAPTDRAVMSERFHDIAISVNGEEVRETVDPRTTLVDFLRETGAHRQPRGLRAWGVRRLHRAGRRAVVRGCLMLAVQCDGARVDTIEGVADSGEIADLQQAFVARNCNAASARRACCSARRNYWRPAAFRAAKRSRAPFRQLLPLHRLSGHRRRGGGGGEGTGRSGAMTERGWNEDHCRFASDPLRARPAQLLYRPLVPRPRTSRLTQGRAQFVSDVTLPRMTHVAFVRSPRAMRVTAIATAAAKKATGVIAVVTGADLAKVITPGRRAHPSQGPQVGAAARDRCRARLLGRAICAVVAQPCRSRGRLRAGRGRLRRAAGRHRRRTARPRHTRDPSRARRQPRLRACARGRRS